jgi:putative ABC transport system permease protein
MHPGVLAVQAIRALAKNKVRTGLTMLGIVIGIASVIAMVAIGQGASQMVKQQVSSIGVNLLMVWPASVVTSGVSLGAGSRATLTSKDVRAIASEIPCVSAVSPVVYASGQIVYENQNWLPLSIRGVGAHYPEVKDWPIEEGSFFSEEDELQARKVCVLGKTVAENLFGGDSPLGKSIRMKHIPVQVVGVLSRKGTSASGSDQDDVVILPWSTVKHVLQGSAFDTIDLVMISAHTETDIPQAERELDALLRQRHHLSEEDTPDYMIRPMTEVIEAATRSARVMTVLLGVIASIALFVGGIGIMNIMLVTVAERTREIGLRMALGARGRDILCQFLTESAVLSGMAGVVGVALGVGASLLISQTLRWPTLISAGSIVLAFGCSSATGIFFGFYPSFRASRLNPIEALRSE